MQGEWIDQLTVQCLLLLLACDVLAACRCRMSLASAVTLMMSSDAKLKHGIMLVVALQQLHPGCH
jgi:hypothetical protein